jgi:hypothetical protein
LHDPDRYYLIGLLVVEVSTRATVTLPLLQWLPEPA